MRRRTLVDDLEQLESERLLLVPRLLRSRTRSNARLGRRTLRSGSGRGGSSGHVGAGRRSGLGSVVTASVVGHRCCAAGEVALLASRRQARAGSRRRRAQVESARSREVFEACQSAGSLSGGVWRINLIVGEEPAALGSSLLRPCCVSAGALPACAARQGRPPVDRRFRCVCCGHHSGSCARLVRNGSARGPAFKSPSGKAFAAIAGEGEVGTAAGAVPSWLWSPGDASE